MSVAKYSPTTIASYAADQDWFAKNGGGYNAGDYPDSPTDNHGYDEYGYLPKNGQDRAGYTEHDYSSGADYSGDGEPDYPLYEAVADAWAEKIIEPAPGWISYQAMIDGKPIKLGELDRDQLIAEIQTAYRCRKRLQQLLVRPLKLQRPKTQTVYDLTDMTQSRLCEVLANYMDELVALEEELVKAVQVVDAWSRGKKEFA